MIEGFFFNRVDAKTGGTAITDQLDLIIEALAHIAQTALTLAQLAMARAQITLNAIIFKPMPVVGCDNGIVHHL